jgi:uncharacterized membrane protein HdeD (DUF308 family)
MGAGLSTIEGLAEAILSGVPVPQAIYTAQQIIGRHALALILCSVLVGVVQVATAVHMVVATLVRRQADRKWLLLSLHVAVLAGGALLPVVDPTVPTITLWVLLAASVVMAAVQFALLTRPGQVVAGLCLVLHATYACIPAVQSMWQAPGGAMAWSTNLVVPLINGYSALATASWGLRG